MSARLTLALAALFTFAGLASAEPPAPAVVVQVKPVSRLMTEFKEMMRQVGGPTLGEGLVKDFERDLKRSLGELGFEGLDLNRPLAAYVVLKEKAEDASLVLVVPATGEKEFVAFLERMKITTEPVKDKQGLYTVAIPEDLFPKDSHLRFTDGGWAYITFNDGDATDAKNLVPVADLFNNADPALVVAKLYPGRVPPKLLAGLLDQLDQTANGLKGFLGGGNDPDAKLMGAFLEQGPKLVRRYGETALKEVDEVGVKFGFDPMTGDTVTELSLVPKAGTPLAKELAAIPATTNRFAGLVPKDAVAGVVLKAPLFAGELREIVAALIEAAQAGLKMEAIPEKLKTVVDEAAKGFVRSVKAGNLDAAFALAGPDKAGKFTLVAGLSFDDPSGVEKALRDAAKDADFGKEFEFDAAKAGGVGIHKVPLTRLLPDDVLRDFARVFGDKPPAYVAFAKDAVFLGFGPGALNAVTAALEAKPGPAPAVDVTWNSGRIVKLATAIDEKAGAEAAKHLGIDDKAVSAFRLTVEGGQTLKVKATLNVRYLPKLLIVGESAQGEFKQVNPGK
jgi:hypothetical protein